MPIREYTNKTEGLQVSDRAADASIRAGREISANYGEASSYIRRTGEAIGSAVEAAGKATVKYMEADEINKGAPAFMGVYAERQKAWEEELKAKPDDPTLQGRYLEQTEAQLQKFRESFTTEGGQKWAESRIDSFRQHLVTKTTADISNVAASQVRVKWDQVTNASSAMAANDPASVKFLMENYNASIDGLVDSNTRLTASQAATVKEQLKQSGAEKIVKSAVMSLTYKNPAAGEAMAKDPAFAKYVDGAEIRQQAAVADRLLKAEDRAARTERREQQIVANDTAIARIVGQTLPEQEGGTMRVPPGLWTELRKAASQPGMKPERIEGTVRYLRAVEAGLEKIKSDPDTLELFDRKLGEGTLTVPDIQAAAADRRLSQVDVRRYNYNANMKDPTRTTANKYFNDAILSFKSSVTKSDPLAGIPDPEGDQRYGQLRFEARQGYEQAFKDGGLKGAQKWVKEDLPELVRPYVGKAGTRATVDRILRQGRQGTEVVPSIADNPDAARRPGESVENYLRRRRGEK